jgi:DNA-binding MarR family transcriptional regulator
MYPKLGFLTHEISYLIRKRFNKEVENLGFTHSQWRALVHLSENENCRQVDLAEILEVKPITLAKQIDLLEASGLVMRNKDKEDRRAYRLALTSKAKPVMNKLCEIASSVENQVLNGLTVAEETSLIQLLEAIKNNMTARAFVVNKAK